MIIGSIIPPETLASDVDTARVLTPEGIMAKHDLQPQEFAKISKELYRTKLRDILFHFAGGPRYDVALYLIATSR